MKVNHEIMKDFKNESSDTANYKWYDEYEKVAAPFKHTKSEADVLQLKAEGKQYLSAETSAFELKQSKSRNSETLWLRTALKQGTGSDKVAASIVLIEDNPKYNLARLTGLISQIRAAKHGLCTMIINSLRDLFLSSLLHPEFKLLKFEEQDLDSIDKVNMTDTVVKTNVSKSKLLAHWYFEDQLRECYDRFITSLGAIASDAIDANREKVICIMLDLLINNAQEEHKLLELIVNKIGDPASKVASKAVFCLNKLLREHPNMKLVVLQEVEKLLFRKNMAQRAQYYAICLLTQFLLNKGDSEIAACLIDVYFAFFKACLKRGEPDSRMMAAILTGVNRAYPFAKMDLVLLRDHMDSLYKVVHAGSFNVSLNALTLLYQVSDKNESEANRFYIAFYRKLLDPQIGVTNKRAMFLNLLFRVLENDKSVHRLCAFIKRIMQVALYFPANMACATLYVISRVIQKRKNLKNMFAKVSQCSRPENGSSEEVGIVSAVDTSDSLNNVKSEVKSEDSHILMNIIMQQEADFEKECVTVKDSGDVKIETDSTKKYDPFYRNPLYAGAHRSFYSELIALSKHFHPSVTLFANNILQGKPVDYTGDPLEDLTLIRFLDRYVFKNPKKLETKKVQRSNDPLAQRTRYTPKGIRSIPVDSAAYLNEKEEYVPIDELYLYQYLKRRNMERHLSANEEDNESVNSEEFNEMLDKLGTNEDFKEIDIAADFGTSRSMIKDDKSETNEESDDMEDGSVSSEDFDGNSEEAKHSSDIEIEHNVDEDDISVIEFSESSDNDSNNMTQAKDKNIRQKRKQDKKKRKEIDENIFMSAEKFAAMLEEQGRKKSKHGGVNVFSDVDGAGSKQIDWETKRHQQLTGFSDRKKRKSSKFKRGHVKKFKHQ